MDKWTHHLEPLLRAQLPTPVTLATHCLVHRHVLVEQMECGHLPSHFVEVSIITNLTKAYSVNQHLQLLTVVPSLILLMDKWTHLLEPPLRAQLPTPVTLATHCLVHRHVLVEQMECGHLPSHFVEVSIITNLTKAYSVNQHLQLLTVVPSLILLMDK